MNLTRSSETRVETGSLTLELSQGHFGTNWASWREKAVLGSGKSLGKEPLA